MEGPGCSPGLFFIGRARGGARQGRLQGRPQGRPLRAPSRAGAGAPPQCMPQMAPIHTSENHVKQHTLGPRVLSRTPTHHHDHTPFVAQLARKFTYGTSLTLHSNNKFVLAELSFLCMREHLLLHVQITTQRDEHSWRSRFHLHTFPPPVFWPNLSCSSGKMTQALVALTL